MHNHSPSYSLAAVARNSIRMESDHFREDLEPARAIGLFQRHVELIELETTSYCNRTCSFCPNSFIDRRSEQLLMPDSAWRAIVDGLRTVDYDRTIVWSRYSEPLSERGIVDRIREVRAAAPRARICINSNGDYLDPDYLETLRRAGVDRLWIDLYIPDDEAYSLAVAHAYHDRFLRRIGQTATIAATSPELTSTIEIPGLQMTTHVRNAAVLKANDMSDRGGLIQLARKTVREAPCYAPYKHLVIDWDGAVVACCQLRSDSLQHAGAIMGRIGEDLGLVDAYVRLAAWRASLRTFGPKAGPCASCNVYEYDSTIATRAIARLLTADAPAAGAVKSVLRHLVPSRTRY